MNRAKNNDVTPLRIAAQNGHLDVVSFLVKRFTTYRARCDCDDTMSTIGYRNNILTHRFITLMAKLNFSSGVKPTYRPGLEPVYPSLFKVLIRALATPRPHLPLQWPRHIVWVKERVLLVRLAYFSSSPTGRQT